MLGVSSRLKVIVAIEPRRLGISPMEYLSDLLTRLPGLLAKGSVTRCSRPTGPSPARQTGSHGGLTSMVSVSTRHQLSLPARGIPLLSRARRHCLRPTTTVTTRKPSQNMLDTPTPETYLRDMNLSGSIQSAGQPAIASAAAGGVGGLPVGRPHGASTDAGLHHPIYDGNSNVSEHLKPDDSADAHYEYDPFGNDITPSNRAGTFQNAFTHRFSTNPIDPTTGLYNYGYRFYDPLTGRWPSRDTIGDDGGLNLYGFVGNDGVDWVDIFEVLDNGLGGEVIMPTYYRFPQNLVDQTIADRSVRRTYIQRDALEQRDAFAESESLDKTGEEAAKRAYEETRKDKEKYEFCGFICCRKSRYFATKMVRGKDNGICTSSDSPCPPETVPVGIYHSHPDKIGSKYGENNFSHDDYGMLDLDRSNFLGSQNGVRKLTKKRHKYKFGNEVGKPVTERIVDGKLVPDDPNNNDLRGELGLYYLDIGTTGPFREML